jgi:glutamyl-tRNA reductase
VSKEDASEWARVGVEFVRTNDGMSMSHACIASARRRVGNHVGSARFLPVESDYARGMASERVIVVGAGSISRAWLPHIKGEGLKVVAVVDLNPEAARKQIDATCRSKPIWPPRCRSTRRTF